MTVIQKHSRREVVKLIQDRMVTEIGGARSGERIEQDLIVMEAVGLISFPQEVEYDAIVEYDAAAIHAAAMHITSGTSLGTKWLIDGNVAVAMLLDLVKAGFRISRDKKASEDELAASLVNPAHGLRIPHEIIHDTLPPSASHWMLRGDDARLIIRHLRDMGFEIVKTGRAHQ